MNKLISLLLLCASFEVFAQEDMPEVGKHVASTNMDAMSMVLSLLLVLGVIVISALVLKRFQPGLKQVQGLKVVTSLHLGAKERIVVVEVGDKQLLLGVTAQQISLLETLPEKLPQNAPLSADFSQSILSVLKGKNISTPASPTKES
ncbi:flagellar biosynthetic protein FliO [Thalassotalea sp. PLHSN55]|uniref:flagellar biosynthetic protein FliO n=1 Tax=Thalassotalea sp. PLHSN55 TaxID=3435888 RepID=UPI003F85F91C